jgi:hypothetical protein
MKKYPNIYLFLFLFALLSTTFVQAQNVPEKSRIIVIGAHPDDCDSDAGGLAILLSKMGHAVKFVAVTNGDAGNPCLAVYSSGAWKRVSLGANISAT